MSSNPKNYRMCVVCRKMHPKQDLYRICRDESNTPFVDYLFKVEGRGAYVCKNAECIATLGNKKKVSKSLGGTLPQELIDQMIKETGTI
ncbi:MAG: YlxR family protein [Clostridia bacterium]|nr:YlxR family protein [Clostridia bacterium]